MKDLYLGIDLGTSAVKILLVGVEGNIIDSVSEEYPLIFPRNGWCEQEPSEWWKGVSRGLDRILEGKDRSLVRAIGVAGQMHGLVVLDENDEVIRPTILWNDGRTEKQVAYLNETIGKERMSQYTANIAFAGFTAPKILWMRENEPENFARIRKIMLPKDYINFLFTGIHSCDYSDASGILCLDVKNRKWSQEMLDICGITEDVMPALYESYEVTGTLKKEMAERFGLRDDVKVVAGAGDNAAAAVGTGTVFDGLCNISLGTSGTVFISNDDFKVDRFNALHSFAHANGKYHLMGVVLSAASCNKWFCQEVLKTSDYNAEQSLIAPEKLGHNNIFFLPYLMGERSPMNDVNARGAFIGLSMNNERSDMMLAVLEGVAFAIRDSIEIARDLGIHIKKSYICGGGAKSPLWRKIFANVLDMEIMVPSIEEGPGYGGAMLAMVGNGVYGSVEECADRFVKIKDIVKPEKELVELYDERYSEFRQLYPALKGFFNIQ